MSTENAANPEVEISADQALMIKHGDFLTALDALCTQYETTVLIAVYYKDQGKAAVEFLGQRDAVIEYGLQGAIANIKNM